MRIVVDELRVAGDGADAADRAITSARLRDRASVRRRGLSRCPGAVRTGSRCRAAYCGPMHVSTGEARTQQQRSEATTGLLVGVARSLFARDGYATTSLGAVVEEAGVTKGALYHHFSGKRALFKAVYEAEWRQLSTTIAEAFRRRRDPWDGVHAGIEAFLNALLDPEVQRILLVDAPGALGAEAVYATSEVGSLAQIERGLRLAMDAGAIPRRPIEPLTHIIHGAVCACAQLVTRSPQPRSTLRKTIPQLHRMLDGFAE
jgi:AcrR family transcriptional regulator